MGVVGRSLYQVGRFGAPCLGRTANSARCAGELGRADLMIDVFIASEVRLLREGLVGALSETPELQVVRRRPTARSSWQRRRACTPGACCSTWPAVGRSELSELVAALPALRAVALGVADDDAEIIAYAEAGAAGYLTRNGSVADLVQMIEEVARGELSCSPRVSAALIRRVGALAAARQRPVSNATALTQRELEILGCRGRAVQPGDRAPLIALTR